MASGSLSQHRFQFGNELYEKPGIFEADLHSEHVLAVVPHFHELFLSDSLGQELDRHLPDQEKPRWRDHFPRDWRAREEGLDAMKVDNIKPQVDHFVFSVDHRVIVVASGRPTVRLISESGS